MKKPFMSETTAQLVESTLLNLPNALGLSGEKGSGKLYLAKHIASNYLGITSTENHLNITIVDCFKEIGIDEIRDLKSNLSVKSAGDNKFNRAIILKNFEQISIEAQNSMLKLLEEPPVDTVILLLCNSENSVLPTISSRLSWIRVLPLNVNALRDIFSSEYSNTEINKAYSLSGGYVSSFINYIQNENDEMKNALKDAKDLLKMNRPERFIKIGKIIKSSDYSPTDFLSILEKIYYASLLSKYNKTGIYDKKMIIKLNNIIKVRENLAYKPNLKLAFTSLIYQI